MPNIRKTDKLIFSAANDIWWLKAFSSWIFTAKRRIGAMRMFLSIIDDI